MSDERPKHDPIPVLSMISIMDAGPAAKSRALDSMEQESRRLTAESREALWRCPTASSGDVCVHGRNPDPRPLVDPTQRDRTLTRDAVRAVVESTAMEIMASRGTADEAWDDGDFAAVIADCVAEQLAERTLSPEILTRIERRIFEQRKQLANLEAQREADLREAFMAGANWLDPEGQPWPGHESKEFLQAAAEYARSKAGGR